MLWAGTRQAWVPRHHRPAHEGSVAMPSAGCSPLLCHPFLHYLQALKALQFPVTLTLQCHLQASRTEVPNLLLRNLLAAGESHLKHLSPSFTWDTNKAEPNFQKLFPEFCVKDLFSKEMIQASKCLHFSLWKMKLSFLSLSEDF